MSEKEKEALKAKMYNVVEEGSTNPDFQKGMVAGQHMKHCDTCMKKFKDFERDVLLGEIYDHAMQDST